MKKDLHVLPKFTMDRLVMQEVTYHITTRLLTRLHRKKKAPWTALPLWIVLYEIQNLKHGEAEMEEFNSFTFNTKSFNPHDPCRIVEDHCTRMYHP